MADRDPQTTGWRANLEPAYAPNSNLLRSELKKMAAEAVGDREAYARLIGKLREMNGQVLEGSDD